jgi:hypothetical protein
LGPSGCGRRVRARSSLAHGAGYSAGCSAAGAPANRGARQRPPTARYSA